MAPSTIEANARFLFAHSEDVLKTSHFNGDSQYYGDQDHCPHGLWERKADAIKVMVEGEVTEEVPASILQKHNDVVLIIDQVL